MKKILVDRKALNKSIVFYIKQQRLSINRFKKKVNDTSIWLELRGSSTSISEEALKKVCLIINKLPMYYYSSSGKESKETIEELLESNSLDNSFDGNANCPRCRKKFIKPISTRINLCDSCQKTLGVRHDN